MSLYLGGEIFDIYKQTLQGEYSHLFVRQGQSAIFYYTVYKTYYAVLYCTVYNMYMYMYIGTGLQGQAVFRNKLTFRPHSTDSQTHRKMTLSIADRFSKAQKIRVLPAVGRDPETDRLARIKVHTLALNAVHMRVRT